MILPGFELLGTGPDRPFRSAAAVLPIAADGRVVLQLRDDIETIGQPGKWCLFGGHIEPDEDIQTAAMREFEEEAGIARSLSAFTPDCAVFSTADDPLVLYIYRLEADFTPADVRVGEGGGFGFFTARQAGKLDFIQYIRPVLDRFFGYPIFSDGMGKD